LHKKKVKSAEPSPLEEKICNYLAAHPQAADTVDGVCQWWLEGSGVYPSRLEVFQALEKLVQSGIVRKSILGDGKEIYASRQS